MGVPLPQQPGAGAEGSTGHGAAAVGSVPAPKRLQAMSLCFGAGGRNKEHGQRSHRLWQLTDGADVK